MFTHRACMAQIQSPTFCPNRASSLAFTGIPLQSTTLTHDLDTHIDAEHDDHESDDDDDDEDESGGVPLDMPHHETHATHETTFITTHDVHTTAPLAQQNLDMRPPVLRVSDRSHPRPEASDISQEEDGRRLRFALEGERSHETAQFDMIAAIAHGLGRPRGAHGTFDMPSPATNQAQTTTRLPPDLQARLQDILPLARTGYTAQPGRFVDEMQIDDDALGVDDPRRAYDFGDFMDLWRLRSLRSDRRLPAFVPGLQPSVRIGRPTEEVSRKTLAWSKVDMQGIRWDLIGPTRKQAIAARSLLHPSRGGSVWLVPEDAGNEDQCQYRFRSFLPAHKAKFNHYQLRNVLAASGRNEVFYATGHQVQRVSLTCPSQNDTIMDLARPGNPTSDFRITTIAASKRSPAVEYNGDNFLLAGGFNGEFAMLDLDSPDAEVSEGYVTHAFNGLVTHVHTYADRRSGSIRAAFCSNDRKVRLLDARSLRFTDEFSYENAINCSKTSPDGRLRVLAGDSREVLITDAERGHPLITLRDQNDHCFACDWSPDGRYVAASAQDGRTVMWDSRYWSKPWGKLDCVMSCPRSVNFTENGALVVAENDDVVSVYEGPLYRKKQDIQFFGSIAGVALLDGGAELAIVNADKIVGGLLTFERSTGGRETYGRKIAQARDRRQDIRWRNWNEHHACDWLSDTVI